MRKNRLIAMVMAFALLSGCLQDTPPKTVKDGPGHPGWAEQFMEMTAGKDGVIKTEELAEVLRNVNLQASKRNTVNLLGVTGHGPSNIGGRTRALLTDVTDSDHLIAGAISGGIWHSTDKGATWTVLNDKMPSLSVTYLTQDIHNPDNIYFSTGEPIGNSSDLPGVGIFKSTDGGYTFNVLPSTENSDFDAVWRVVADPNRGDVIYVATGNSGLWRSLDGGQNFQNVFVAAAANDISDIEIFPDTSVIIGVRRDGVYQSVKGDSGTYTKLTSGLPDVVADPFYRLELAFCDSFPNVVYVAYENDSRNGLLGLWKSTNQGTSWDTISSPENIGARYLFPWYCMLLSVKPDNPDFVIKGGVDLAFSEDGGQNWDFAYPSHADYHQALWNPRNPDSVIIGNDGGIWRYKATTFDFTVQDLNQGYRTMQFYAGAYFPTQVSGLGGSQDNGTNYIQSGNPAFTHVFGGDGCFTDIDQQNPDRVFVSWQRGNIQRTTNFSSFMTWTDVKGQMDGDGDGTIDDGAWFVNPFLMNEEDPDQIYFTTHGKIWRTLDGADNWSPLTQYLPSGDQKAYCLGLTRGTNPDLFIGGDEGLFYRVNNAASAIPGFEVNMRFSVPVSVRNDFMSCIETHPADSSIIYVSFSTMSSSSRIWKVTNAQNSLPTWNDISGDLPSGLPVYWIEAHPQKPDSFLIAATLYGIYTTIDGGQTWSKETDVPNTSIFQIRLRESDLKLFIFTHGRGLWTADLPVFVDRQKPVEMADLKLWPNPFSEKISLRGEGLAGQKIELLDLSGRKLKSWIPATDFLEADLSDLPVGTYFIKSEGFVRKVLKI